MSTLCQSSVRISVPVCAIASRSTEILPFLKDNAIPKFDVDRWYLMQHCSWGRAWSFRINTNVCPSVISDDDAYSEVPDLEPEFCDHEHLVKLFYCGQLILAGDSSKWTEIYREFQFFDGDREVVFEDEHNRMIRIGRYKITYPTYP